MIDVEEKEAQRNAVLAMLRASEDWTSIAVICEKTGLNVGAVNWALGVLKSKKLAEQQGSGSSAKCRATT